MALGSHEFVSVSVDQKVRMWRYINGAPVIYHDGYTVVPDVCGILDLGVVERERRFVIYGTGMELLALSGGDSDAASLRTIIE